MSTLTSLLTSITSNTLIKEGTAELEKAHNLAKKLKLKHVGFGMYENEQGIVVAKIVNDKLVRVNDK